MAPRLGDVVEIGLPNGEFAYGRTLRDASVAFYRQRSSTPGQPPIGSRDFEFVVGVYRDVLQAWPVVGRDPSANADEDWAPPYSVRDAISGQFRIYHKGQMRASTESECRALEPAAVWDKTHVIDRLTRRSRAN